MSKPVGERGREGMPSISLLPILVYTLPSGKVRERKTRQLPRDTLTLSFISFKLPKLAQQNGGMIEFAYPKNSPDDSLSMMLWEIKILMSA